MKNPYSYGFAILALLLVSCSTAPSEERVSEEIDTSDYKVIAYVAGWNDFESDDIAAEKLTHIHYAFCNVYDGLAQEGDSVEVRNWSRTNDSLNYLKLHALKKRNPDLKIIGSIGGWTWSGGFHEAVLTDSSRAAFTQSVLDYMTRYSLDGIDFDWEYPNLMGNYNTYGPEDTENFVDMLKSVREALNEWEEETGKHFTTSIASGGFDQYIEANNIGEAAKHLDYINIMTYDFHGGWDSITGHHTNLYSLEEASISADQAVKKHVEAGIPIDKLVMGVAFYSREWRDVNISNGAVIGAPAGSGGSGFPYRELDTLIGKYGYIEQWDSVAQAPFIWNADSSAFLTYDNPRSIRAKCDYIKAKGMGGAMFWEYSEDADEKLLDAIVDNL